MRYRVEALKDGEVIRTGIITADNVMVASRLVRERGMELGLDVDSYRITQAKGTTT